jgi:hypothetical protein
MTEAEKQQVHRDAERDAAIIGGIIAALLLRRNRNRVRFDSHSLQFIIGGRPVSLEVIRGGLQHLANRQTAQINKATDALAANVISVDDWLEQMRRIIASGHTIAAALSLGSVIAALASSTVTSRIDREWQFVAKFAGQMGAGEAIPKVRFASVSGRGGEVIPKHKFSGVPSSKIASRARLYVGAMRITFSSIGLAVHKAAGYKFARRRVTVAEHCHNTIATHGCFELASMGWMDIDKMVPIGNATCGNFCKCFIEYQ